MEIAVYGHFGFALLLIPTAAADYLEYERFLLLDAIEPYINAGKVKVFSINSITCGTDAQGEVSVRLQKNGMVVNGQGSDTDIVIASAQAYINALNKLYTAGARQHPQLSAL